MVESPLRVLQWSPLEDWDRGSKSVLYPGVGFRVVRLTTRRRGCLAVAKGSLHYFMVAFRLSFQTCTRPKHPRNPM